MIADRLPPLPDFGPDGNYIGFGEPITLWREDRRGSFLGQSRHQWFFCPTLNTKPQTFMLVEPE